MRTTYTLAELRVPKMFYNFVRKKLLAAGYTHAVDDKENQIDMTGIALVWKGEDINTKPRLCSHGYKDWDECPVCCH